MPDGEVLQLVWALLVVVAVVALAWLFTRFVAGRAAGGMTLGVSKERPMKLLAQLSVGREQRVLLIQVGEQYYLLGAAQGGVTLLDKLSEEEAAELRRQAPPADPGERMGFQKALKKVLEQRNRQRRS